MERTDRVTRVGPALDEGELTGRTADGNWVSGYAVVADRQAVLADGARRSSSSMGRATCTG